MANDNKLALDEAERIARYEAIQHSAQENIQAGVRNVTPTVDDPRITQLGEHIHDRAVNEVVNTDREVAVRRTAARGSQFIDYVFYLIYGIIGLQILFDLLGARKTNPISQLVAALSSPLLALFRNLMPDPAAGRFQFRLSYLMALVIYLLLHLAVKGLLRVIANRKTEV